MDPRQPQRPLGAPPPIPPWAAPPPRRAPAAGYPPPPGSPYGYPPPPRPSVGRASPSAPLPPTRRPGSPDLPAGASGAPATTPVVDADPERLEPSAGGRRDERIVGGIVIVVIGLFLLAVQLVPDAGRLIPLVLGATLLVLAFLRREYGLLIAGCIVGGVGVGVALQGVFSGVEAGGIVVVCLGLGFVAIYALSLLLGLAEAHWWPLIPGGIILVIGVVLLSGRVMGDVIRWWPLMLMAVGLLVVARALLGQPGSSRR